MKPFNLFSGSIVLLLAFPFQVLAIGLSDDISHEDKGSVPSPAFNTSEEYVYSKYNISGSPFFTYEPIDEKYNLNYLDLEKIGKKQKITERRYLGITWSAREGYIENLKMNIYDQYDGDIELDDILLVRNSEMYTDRFGNFNRGEESYTEMFNTETPRNEGYIEIFNIKKRNSESYTELFGKIKRGREEYTELFGDIKRESEGYVDNVSSEGSFPDGYTNLNLPKTTRKDGYFETLGNADRVDNSYTDIFPNSSRSEGYVEFIDGKPAFSDDSTLVTFPDTDKKEGYIEIYGNSLERKEGYLDTYTKNLYPLRKEGYVEYHDVYVFPSRREGVL